ncbi:MAG: hypothetical protein VYE01_02435 [Pseudomonadota bacterium]|nr:hypothetical protein [Pseudomonadota bacterium]
MPDVSGTAVCQRSPGQTVDAAVLLTDFEQVLSREPAVFVVGLFAPVAGLEPAPALLPVPEPPPHPVTSMAVKKTLKTHL